MLALILIALEVTGLLIALRLWRAGRLSSETLTVAMLSVSPIAAVIGFTIFPSVEMVIVLGLTTLMAAVAYQPTVPFVRELAAARGTVHLTPQEALARVDRPWGRAALRIALAIPGGLVLVLLAILLRGYR